jgi:hypothetical protein
MNNIELSGDHSGRCRYYRYKSKVAGGIRQSLKRPTCLTWFATHGIQTDGEW